MGNYFYGVAILTGLTCLSVYWLQTRLMRNRFPATLRHLGIRPQYCGQCEYDLRAIQSDQCPECGAELAPLVTNQSEESQSNLP